MARNTYGGNCYRCGLWVASGTGYFEKRKDGPGFRVQHCYHTHNGGVTCEKATKNAAQPSPSGEKADND